MNSHQELSEVVCFNIIHDLATGGRKSSIFELPDCLFLIDFVFLGNLPDRVVDAYWNPRKAVRLKIAGNKPTKSSKLDDEDHADNSENSVTVLSNEDRKEISKEISSSEQSDLFDIVSCERENFVQSWHPPAKHYDTILW